MIQDPIKQSQLLNTYRDIEGDIGGLLDGFSPGDNPALIIDKLGHLKQTLTDLMALYEPGTIEYTSVMNQYGQTLRAAMNKGIEVEPERDTEPATATQSSPGLFGSSSPVQTAPAEATYSPSPQTIHRDSPTPASIDALAVNLRAVDFGIKRGRNGLGGERKIHFNHRPPTVFDDVWYGGNEAAMDAMIGPKAADDVMVMTHLALQGETAPPSASGQPTEVVIDHDQPHTNSDQLNNSLDHLMNTQTKRRNTAPTLNLTPPPRF